MRNVKDTALSLCFYFAAGHCTERGEHYEED